MFAPDGVAPVTWIPGVPLSGVNIPSGDAGDPAELGVKTPTGTVGDPPPPATKISSGAAGEEPEDGVKIAPGAAGEEPEDGVKMAGGKSGMARESCAGLAARLGYSMTAKEFSEESIWRNLSCTLLVLLDESPGVTR